MAKDLEARFREYVQKLNIDFQTAEDLMDLIATNQQERAIKKEEFLKTYKSKLPLRPSSALTCGRKLSYELANFKEKGTFPVSPMTIRQERIFKAGDVFEEFELNRLSDYHGLDITHRQQKLNIAKVDGHEISGNIDAILWRGGRAAKMPYLIDIKSITTYKYKEIAETQFPKIENFAQLCLYGCSPGYNELMELEGVPKENRKAALFYVNKDSLEYHMIEFVPNQEVFDKLIARFTKLYELFKENKLAPRDYVKVDRYPCGKYCSFAKYCLKKDEDKKLQVPETFKFSGDEDTDIHNLWHLVGESSTYISNGKVLEVEPLLTKWKLTEHGEEKDSAAPVGSKKVKKSRKTNKK